MEKKLQILSRRFNKFSTHIVASSANVANNFLLNNIFFFLDSIIVYNIYLFIFCTLTFDDGKSTIKFKDYIDFLSNSQGNRNWITYNLGNSLTKFCMANYVIQHIIGYWITNERAKYEKLLPCIHSISLLSWVFFQVSFCWRYLTWDLSRRFRTHYILTAIVRDRGVNPRSDILNKTKYENTYIQLNCRSCHSLCRP